MVVSAATNAFTHIPFVFSIRTCMYTHSCCLCIAHWFYRCVSIISACLERVQRWCLSRRGNSAEQQRRRCDNAAEVGTGGERALQMRDGNLPAAQPICIHTGGNHSDRPSDASPPLQGRTLRAQRHAVPSIHCLNGPGDVQGSIIRVLPRIAVLVTGKGYAR